MKKGKNISETFNINSDFLPQNVLSKRNIPRVNRKTRNDETVIKDIRKIQGVSDLSLKTAFFNIRTTNRWNNLIIIFNNILNSEVI